MHLKESNTFVSVAWRNGAKSCYKFYWGTKDPLILNRIGIFSYYHENIKGDVQKSWQIERVEIKNTQLHAEYCHLAFAKMLEPLL